MKNKEFTVDKLDKARNLVNNLYNDIENGKQHVTQEYLLSVLQNLSNNLELISNRLDLED